MARAAEERGEPQLSGGRALAATATPPSHAPPALFGEGGNHSSSSGHWELLRHARKLHSTVREALRSSSSSSSSSSAESPGAHRLHVAAAAAAGPPPLASAAVTPSGSTSDDRRGVVPLTPLPAQPATTAASRRLSIVSPLPLLPSDGWFAGAWGGGGVGGGGAGGGPHPPGGLRSPARKASFEERLVFASSCSSSSYTTTTITTLALEREPPPLAPGTPPAGGGGGGCSGDGIGGDGIGGGGEPLSSAEPVCGGSSLSAAQRELAAAVSQLEMAATLRGLLLPSGSPVAACADCCDSEVVSFLPAASLTLSPLQLENFIE